MNIVKFFHFVADTVFKAIYIACVSAVNMELNFGSDADFVRTPVLAAAPTSISFLEPSVYMWFHPLYLFSTTSLNLFWYAIVGVCSFGRSAREKFILVLVGLQVGFFYF